MTTAVYLTKGLRAEIDDEDAARVERHSWFANETERGRFYAAAKIAGNKTYLHRYIMGVNDPKIEVDHVDGNPLNCRRSNLRFATREENGANRRKPAGARSSRYKGVVRLANGFYRARVTVGRETYYLGDFASEVEAALAYDRAAREHFGPFARPNLPGVHA